MPVETRILNPSLAHDLRSGAAAHTKPVPPSTQTAPGGVHYQRRSRGPTSAVGYTRAYRPAFGDGEKGVVSRRSSLFRRLLGIISPSSAEKAALAASRSAGAAVCGASRAASPGPTNRPVTFLTCPRGYGDTGLRGHDTSGVAGTRYLIGRMALVRINRNDLA